MLTKKTKFSIAFRAAMLNQFGRRCVYTGDTLDLRNLHLDHVLPWTPFCDTDEHWATTRAQYGLREDFDPNGPENLLPCTAAANLQKSNRRFSESNFRYFLELAAAHRDQVLAAEKEYLDEANREQLIIELQTLHADDPEALESLMDQLQAENAPESDDYESDSSLRFTRAEVTLNCIPPNTKGGGRLQLSALVTFRRYTLSNAMVTLNHREFVRELMGNVNAPVTPFGRRWIFGNHPDKPQVGIDIGNTRFFVSRSAASELAEVCDAMWERVRNRALMVEELWGTLPFEPTGDETFRLFRVPWGLWQVLLEFARTHDFARGKSIWHAFNAHNDLRIMTTHGPVPEIGLTKRCVFWPGTASDYTSLLPSRDNVWLCWRRQDFDWDHSTNASQVMNATETANWIREWLVPAALRWYETKSGGSDQSSFIRLLTGLFQRANPNGKHRIDDLLYLAYGYTQPTDSGAIPDAQLGSSFVQLQQFYNAHGNLQLPTSDAAALLHALQELGKKHPHRLGYDVISNFCQGAVPFGEAIERDRKLIFENAEIPASYFDFRLRSLGHLCGAFDDELAIPIDDMRFAVAVLKPLYVRQHAELYRERLERI